MIAEIVKHEGHGQWSVANKSVLKDLYTRNLAVPDITGVIFSKGKKDGHDVLTTVLKFADGTQSAVMNSVHDELQRNPGESEQDFDERKKELGILYAYAKRIMVGKLVYSDCTKSTTLKYGDFAGTLKTLVRGAYDCQKAAELAKAKKAAAKAKEQMAVKPVQKAVSNAEIATMLLETAKLLKETQEQIAAGQKTATKKGKKA